LRSEETESKRWSTVEKETAEANLGNWPRRRLGRVVAVVGYPEGGGGATSSAKEALLTDDERGTNELEL